MRRKTMIEGVALGMLVSVAMAVAGEYDLKVPAAGPAPEAVMSKKAAPATPHRSAQRVHTAPVVAAHPGTVVAHAAPAVAAHSGTVAVAGKAHAASSMSATGDVWASLVAGNARFVAGKPQPRPLVSQREALVAGQRPGTIVLTCSDSRVPPELLFDQSLGDLFVVRTAGQVVDAVATGSIEYAVEHLGANLIVVLGHEKCGAVTAALSGEPMPTPSLTALVGHIRPGIDKACADASKAERLACAIEANVDECAAQLITASPVLSERLEQGTLLVVKAFYPLGSGKVKELGREGGAKATPETHHAAAEPVTHAQAAAVEVVPAAAGIHAPAPAVAKVVPEAAALPAPAPVAHDAVVAAPARPVEATVVLDAAPPRNTPGVSSGAPVIPTSPPPIAWEGNLRFRYEARSILDYRLPGSFKRSSSQRLLENGDQSIMRTRFGGGLKFAPGVKGYFSLQDARVMGAEGSPSGTLANVDLFLAYADIDSIGRRPFALRVGRQVFQYGDGRVVAGSDWGNAGRAWDGARLRFTPKNWQVDGLVSWISEGRLTGKDRLFTGGDVLWKPAGFVEAELYSFVRTFGDTGFTSTETGRKGAIYDATSGMRLRLMRGRFDVRGEGAMQRGHRADDGVTAWFGAVRAAMELPGAWKPRVQAEWIGASGDKNPTDGISQRYDPGYWGGHGYLGTLDVVGCSNVTDWNGVIVVQPRKSWGMNAEVHRFRLMQATDAWADDAGNTLRRSTAGTAGLDVGTELDLGFKWDPRSRVGLSGGWSHLWIGEYVINTGGGEDLDWGYLQLAFQF